MNNMTDLERIEFYYKKGWADESKLREYVKFNTITPEDFKKITGLEY